MRRQDSPEFIDRSSAAVYRGARRRGKYLLVSLDDDAVLVGHLRMSGQLRYFEPPLPASAKLHTHAVIGFEDQSELRFVDPRTFGELFISSELDSRGVPTALSKIGRDPLVDGLDAAAVHAMVARRHRPLKAFLLDQREICGIGNVYADEICFAARLSPERRTDSLTRRDAGRLARAISQVLGEAVRDGGSSLRDERYRDVLGGLGTFQTAPRRLRLHRCAVPSMPAAGEAIDHRRALGALLPALSAMTRDFPPIPEIGRGPG